ncbi:hypothetical protein HAX54_006655 [Datura stramonium]|uniref:Uncharacterized protein n=1 Tax=Datura stramonium TaxID=4076 RepID=A0ABS8TBV0_DATST|nr:hypothetical protein [Datura stramonium]
MVEGKPVAQLDRSEVDKEILKWKCALIAPGRMVNYGVQGERDGIHRDDRKIRQGSNEEQMSLDLNWINFPSMGNTPIKNTFDVLSVVVGDNQNPPVDKGGTNYIA